MVVVTGSLIWLSVSFFFQVRQAGIIDSSNSSNRVTRGQTTGWFHSCCFCCLKTGSIRLYISVLCAIEFGLEL